MVELGFLCKVLSLARVGQLIQGEEERCLGGPRGVE
jgi:hypothetical protein